MSTKIRKQIRIETRGGEVFKALVTPGLIKKWWGASQAIVIPDEDGIYAVSWGDADNPESISTARIKEYSPYIKLSLTDFDRFTPERDTHEGSQVNFIIECHSNFCELTVENWGFPREDQSEIQEREQEWEKVLNSLKKVVESEDISVN